MGIQEWWPKLKPSTRDWLVENNGDVVPPAVAAEIAAAGGPAAADVWWAGGSGDAGLHLPDDAVDWIEAVANGESPGS